MNLDEIGRPAGRQNEHVYSFVGPVGWRNARVLHSNEEDLLAELVREGEEGGWWF